MAAIDTSCCVMCKLNPESETDKFIKCYGNCNNYLHYGCSSFKPSEIKFLESHKYCVKWICETCANDNASKGLVSSINSLSAKLDAVFDVMRDQVNKISENSAAIINLQNKSSEKPKHSITQNVNTQETVRHETGPNTRSKTNLKDFSLISTEGTTTTNFNLNFTDKKRKRLGQTVINKNQETPRQENIEEDTLKTNSESLKKTSALNLGETRRKTIRGKRCNTSISTVESRKWLFLSRLVNTTTKNDIIEYLAECNVTPLSCEKLDIKNKDIAAFKIAVNENIYNEMFNEDMWPNNAIIRPFRNNNFQRMRPAKFPV